MLFVANANNDQNDPVPETSVTTPCNITKAPSSSSSYIVNVDHESSSITISNNLITADSHNPTDNDADDTWSSNSTNNQEILQALSATQSNFKTSNERSLIFRESTIHVPTINQSQIRESLPDKYSDKESSLAFLLLIFGATLCSPLLCVNWMFINSPNKKARNVARLSICLTVPFTILIATTALAFFSNEGNNKISDLMELTVPTVTCSDGAWCCAEEGSLVRYVSLCGEAGIVDPTGRLCRYELSPCKWINESISNTTSIHCHGLIDDKKTICHKHRARHVTGKEPGEL